MKTSKIHASVRLEPISEDAQVSEALHQAVPKALKREEGPLYRQLASRLRQPIELGQLSPGSSLPREADLASQYGVSLITVRQALRELEVEGLIQKRVAKPAVVLASQKPDIKPLEFQSLSAIAMSSTDRRLVINSYRKEHSVLACESFGLAPETLCFCLRALLYASDEPITQTAFYFPPNIGKRLRRADFDDVVVFRAVQRHLGIKLSRARIKVRAEIADEGLAVTLGYKIGAPILATEMLYFSSSGEPVELTVSKNRGDKFSITYDAPNDLA